jgi:hypothetical protein
MHGSGRLWFASNPPLCDYPSAFLERGSEHSGRLAWESAHRKTSCGSLPLCTWHVQGCWPMV